jgi:hypothetical protein
MKKFRKDLELYRIFLLKKIRYRKLEKMGLICTNALESQSLIYHYKNSCEEKNCLSCSIGFKLLKES